MCFNPVKPGVFRESAGLGGGIFHPPFWLSSRNSFQGRGKICCYANFFCYANFCIVFVSNFRGWEKVSEGEGGRLPVDCGGKSILAYPLFVNLDRRNFAHGSHSKKQSQKSFFIDMLLLMRWLRLYNRFKAIHNSKLPIFNFGPISLKFCQFPFWVQFTDNSSLI